MTATSVVYGQGRAYLMRINAMNATGERMRTLVAGFMQESRAVGENCKWRIWQQCRKGKLALHNAYGYRSVNPEASVIRLIFGSHNEGCGLTTKLVR